MSTTNLPLVSPPPTQCRPPTGRETGLDRGLQGLLLTAEGTAVATVATPPHSPTAEKRLATPPPRVARRMKGSTPHDAPRPGPPAAGWPPSGTSRAPAAAAAAPRRRWRWRSVAGGRRSSPATTGGSPTWYDPLRWPPAGPRAARW